MVHIAVYDVQLAKNLKILFPKQMLKVLPIALVQANASNISGNLLNEIEQIIYFLYREK